MKSILFSWPEGKTGACTSSWDDGTMHDRQLVKMMNNHGHKGTFNLNSGKLGFTAEKSGWKPYVDSSELTSLYDGHEIAAHTVNHPFLWRIPDLSILGEVLNDRANLEQICGYPVVGMAFPFGGPNDRRVRENIKNAGILYSRSVESTDNFDIPLDFLYWTPTCHCSADLPAIWNRFLQNGNPDKLYYLWGHSYEFDERKDWDRFENFLKLSSGSANVWYATNIEIYDYVKAWRSLRCATNNSSIKNCSSMTVYFRYNGTLCEVKPGEVMTVKENS